MFWSNYNFPFFINRINCIYVVKKQFMQIFLWGYPYKEYPQHESAYYFDQLLSHSFLLLTAM